ncbi:YncE family protein [Kitasatospora sp. NPDC051853]|uniref:YncE family protein n=1 Tax=Kitasatospora sp. NPDC051853 TaxID=3364058 RepID=UPI0037AB9A33
MGRGRVRWAGLGLVAAVLAGCGQVAPPAPEPPAPVPSVTAPSAPVPPAAPQAAGAQETLVVADFGGDTVTFVDPAAGAVGSVRVGTAPWGVALGPDGRAWVAAAEGVGVVDTASRRVTATVPYRTASGPVTTGEYRGGGMGIALSPDGTRVYVGVNVPGKQGVLEVIDTATRQVTDVVQVGRRPFDVVVARDGHEVYAVGHDSFDVTAVDAGTLRPRRMEVAPYGTEGGLGSWLKPHYAEVASDGRLLLPFEGERLAVLDPADGRVTVRPMTADTHQHGTALAPDGTLLVVGTGPIGGSDHGPSLTVRAPDGGERVIPLDGPHEEVAVSRDGRTAYVTGGFSRPGGWDGVTVVDLTSGRTHRVAAGKLPLGVVVLPSR